MPFDISPLESEHLAKVRARALRVRVAALADRPDPALDTLGAIAWTATVVGPDARELIELVHLAHDVGRYRWREIVHAMGGDWATDTEVLRIAQHYRRRRP